MLLSACLALSLAAPPDLILPGHHALDHQIVLEGELHGYRLIAAPTAGFGGTIEVELGVPFPFSSKYGTRVWAFPGDVEVPAQAQGGGFGDGVLFARLPAEIDSVPDLNPLRKVVTRLRVEGLDGGELRLVEVGEEREGWAAFYAVASGALTTGLVLGIVLLRRRRRRRRRDA